MEDFLKWAWAPAVALVTLIAWAVRVESRTKQNTDKIAEHDKTNDEMWAEFKEMHTCLGTIQKDVALIAQSITHNSAVAEQTQRAIADHANTTSSSSRRMGERMENVEKAIDRIETVRALDK